MLENDLENERKTFKAWTDSGKKVHDMISKKNWKECLGYMDGIRDVDTENKITLKTPVRFVSSGVDEPKSTFEKGSTSASQEIKNDEKILKVETKETIKSVRKGKNIGLLSKGQLKKKLSEVTQKSQVKSPKRNRNGKQGISKESDYKNVLNSPRKTCYNCGNTNHLAIDCRKNKKEKTAIPKSDVRGRSVFYKPQNPCFHCGSSWHSIYTCSSYHELYHNIYDPLPKFNKTAHVNKSVITTKSTSDKTSSDKGKTVRSNAESPKLKLSKVRTQQV